MARKVIDSLWNLWPFLLVLVVSIFMRFWDISIFPKLEVDEDIYRYLADGFWSGQHEMFCIPYTYLPHPPLFFAIGNFFTMLFGNYIVSLRLLSALSGVLVCILIYAVISRYVDRKTGCIAGLAQAVMPTAIVFERLAVGYTLQVFYIFVSLYCFSRFVRIKYADEHQTDVVSSERIWVVFAGVAAGLGFITEVGGVILVVLLVFYFFKQHYDFFWYIMPGAVLLPGMVYFLLFVRHPSWFIADLTINSGRNNMTLFLAAVMYGILIFLIPVARKAMSRMYDFSMKGIIVLWPLYAVIIAAVPMSYPLVRGGYGFYWIGILGLFLLPRRTTQDNQLRIMLLSVAGSYILYNLFINRVDVFLLATLPFLSIGIGLITMQSWQVWKSIVRCKYMKQISVLLAILPICYIAWQSTNMLIGKLLIDRRQDVQALQGVASYLRHHADRDDLLVLGVALNGEVDMRIATISQFMYYQETDLAYAMVGEYYTNERLLFDISIESADYYVTTNRFSRFVRGEMTLEEYMGNYIDNKPVVEDMLLAKRKVSAMADWPYFAFGNLELYVRPERYAHVQL